MPCYPCSHCNKCGIFSIRLEIRCATCDADVVIGQKNCPSCGTPYRNNIKRGMMGKPKGTVDYLTRQDESLGRDSHRMVDMSNYGNRGTRVPLAPPPQGSSKSKEPAKRSRKQEKGAAT